MLISLRLSCRLDFHDVAVELNKSVSSNQILGLLVHLNASQYLFGDPGKRDVWNPTFQLRLTSIAL